MLGGVISLVVLGSFIVAFMLQDFYGGSMRFLNGRENLIFGINFGIFVSCALVATLVLAVGLELKSKK